MPNPKVLGRRDFLTLSALATGAVALASCTQAPVSSPTKPPAAAPTQAPAASAPTQAPAAAAPTKAPEPTKPAAAATAAPAQATAAPPKVAASPTPAEKIGKHLIGKLEGPEVITDPAKWPKTFKEAPMLADLVKAGKIPPLNERLPQEPLVVKPVHEIGKYGGMIRRGFTGPADQFNGNRTAGNDNVLFWEYTGNKPIPNIARGWEVSDGGKVTTVLLRRGMKWSDGKPFTADDFMFWYEDIYLNKDLCPTPTPYMTVNFKPVVMEKVDAYTVVFRAPEPYYLLPEIFCGTNALAGHALFYYSANMGGPYAPAHYLKQFHPKYTSLDEVEKKAKDAKFDNWKNLFRNRNNWGLNADLPALNAWKTTSPISSTSWILERNPYSIWVDTDGNQLPYIDKIVMTLGENLEIINLRSIAGEYDFQERFMDLRKLPIFLENQKKSNYRIFLDPGDFGGDSVIFVNNGYEADPEIAKWLTNVDFRRALSLGVERDQLNEAFWIGMGVPGSPMPCDLLKHTPGPEYRTLWHTFDLKKSNELLDKLGLDKKDSEGFRLRTDGKGRLRFEVMTMGQQFMDFTAVGEMISEQWKKIGIKADVREIERSLWVTRVNANEQQLAIGTNNGTENIFAHNPNSCMPFDGESVLGSQFGRWFATGGTGGKEPPARMREAMEKYRKALSSPDAEAVKLAQEIWKISVEDVWSIGIVGVSPAVQGLRVVKTNMGNQPSRLLNNPAHRTPGPSQPPTFFYKS